MCVVLGLRTVSAVPVPPPQLVPTFPVLEFNFVGVTVSAAGASGFCLPKVSVKLVTPKPDALVGVTGSAKCSEVFRLPRPRAFSTVS
jgi:hypothetical protein